MKQSCLNCLHDNHHPLGITLIDNICSGCYTHLEKNTIDWQLREEALFNITSSAIKQSPSSSIYDCVIPIRGDAEDYFVVEKVLDLHLNPLLVAVNDYFFNDLGWHNLHNLITIFDLDSQLYTPNIFEYKELVSTSFRKYLHVLYPSLSLNASYPVHVAIERQIPLVIWGQCQPIEQVGKFSHVDSVEMTQWSQIEHDRLGLDIENVVGNGAQLNPSNLVYYEYPSQAVRLGSKAPLGIYLSNFFRWDPLVQNHSILKFGFKPQFQSATFDPYDRAGSSIYYTAHELSRLNRHGYRKVRDHLNREIRHGRVNRVSALKIYDYYFSSKIYLKSFFRWLDISDSGIEWIYQHLLSKHIPILSNEPCHTTTPIPDFLPPKIKDLIYLSHLPQSDYIAFGKGI